MPRRKFTARDLAPLRRITERIIEKQPDAGLVVAAAGPFKRRIRKAGHEERTEIRLPVQIESRNNPDGVPLHEIAKAARAEVPGVTGVTVKPGGVSLQFDKEPTTAQRRRIERLLSDQARLEGLKPAIRAAPTRVTARELPADDLTRALHDPQTTDAAWLRAFRTYATENLIPRPTE